MTAKPNAYALIQGGEGPDVWDRELLLHASDINDALTQAGLTARDMGGHVVNVEMNNHPEPKLKKLPDLVPGGELEKILGSICFKVACHARRLHDLKIYDVKTHAEEEQAVFIHWALNLWLEHGDEWREVGEEILRG